MHHDDPRPAIDLGTALLQPARAGDAEALAALRVLAMRDSLERVGRFDPERARQRLLSTFDAACTWHIADAAQRVGFVVLRTLDDALLLDHLYVLPAHQGRGLGGAVVHWVLAQADAKRLPVRLGALRESDANRFYQRHGFALVEQTAWDNHYQRPAPNPARHPQGSSGGSGTSRSTSRV